MTYPIQNGTTVFVKRKGDDSIKSIEDMSGKKVGTQTSCYNEDDTKKFNEKLSRRARTAMLNCSNTTHSLRLLQSLRTAR